MNAIFQFIMRQSGWLTFFLLLFAVLNGGYVSEGLWQGSGLHGFTLQPGAKGGPPRVVSTWTAFVEMLLFTGLASLMLGLKAWYTAKISRVVLKSREVKDTEANMVIFRSQTGRRPRR